MAKEDDWKQSCICHPRRRVLLPQTPTLVAWLKLKDMGHQWICLLSDSTELSSDAGSLHCPLLMAPVTQLERTLQGARCC